MMRGVICCILGVMTGVGLCISILGDGAGIIIIIMWRQGCTILIVDTMTRVLGDS